MFEWFSSELLRSLSPILFQNLLRLFRRKLLVEVVVDLHGGRPAAGADALDLLEGKQSILGGAFVSDAQALLELRNHLVSAAEHTAYVAADLHVVFAARARGQHG